MNRRVWGIALLLLLLAAPVGAATYWVSTSGNDSNGCTNSLTPLTTGAKLTITNALATCPIAGNTLMIGDGTYQEDYYAGGANGVFPSGTSGTPTTIRAEHARQATLKNNVTTDGGPAVLWIGRRDWITFDGITVDAGGSVPTILAGVRFYEPGSADWPTHIVFKNGEVFNSSSTHHVNLMLGHCDDCTIENNLLHDNDLANQDDPDNNGDGFSHAMYMQGNNLIVRQNTIYNISSYGWHPYTGTSVFSTNATIEGNRCTNIGAACILVEDMTGSINIYNNVISQTYGHAVLIRNHTNGATIRLMNNTCWATSGGAKDIGHYGGYTPTTSGTNNLCSFYTTSDGYNNFGTLTTNLVPTSGYFVNTGAGNFHPVEGGSACGGGTNLTSFFTTDQDGVARPASGAWDRGAYVCAPPVTIMSGPNGTVQAVWHLNAGQGTVAGDSVGDHPGTFSPTSGWSTGLIGPFAGNFDGTRAVVVSNVTGLRPTTGQTLSAWVKFNGVPDNCDVVSNGDSTFLRLRPFGEVGGGFYNGTDWPMLAGGASLDNNQRHHVLWTYNQVQQDLYADGVLVASQADSAPITYTLGPAFKIAEHAGTRGINDCIGIIDEVTVLDGGCDAACVANLYAAKDRRVRRLLRAG